jgi:D-glycero-alpha-D-manno-heptose-7-phosphate kinase
VLQGDTAIEAADIPALAADPETALIGLIARYFELPPAEISVRSSSPQGGGLGASSALTVAMIAATEHQMGLPERSAEGRASLARDIEAQLMGLPTGRQDHFPALLGGALRIEHQPGGERVIRIDADLQVLNESLIVAYTGQSHFSAGQNWEVIRRRLNGDPDMVERFEGIVKTARRLAEALGEGALEEVGSLMSRDWELRRGLAPGVSTERIEELLGVALETGAWGGKACGAGGGGCLAILAPARDRPAAEKALAARGAQVLATGPVATPLTVTVS